MTPSGVLTEYSVGTPQAQPWDITALPSGDLWFTEENVDQVGVITQEGWVTEYPAGSYPTHITTGPDGNVWFTDEIGDDIARLDPSDPYNITYFPVPTAGALPWSITSGPDGNLWFTELVGNVGKITTDGTITEYPVTGGTSGIAGIAAAPSGDALWFTENDAGLIGSIGIDGTLGPETLNAGYYPFGITAGPDGNMWFAVGYADEIGRVNLVPPPPPPPPPPPRLLLHRRHLLHHLRHRHHHRRRSRRPSAWCRT